MKLRFHGRFHIRFTRLVIFRCRELVLNSTQGKTKNLLKLCSKMSISRQFRQAHNLDPRARPGRAGHQAGLVQREADGNQQQQQRAVAQRQMVLRMLNDNAESNNMAKEVLEFERALEADEAQRVRDAAQRAVAAEAAEQAAEQAEARNEAAGGLAPGSTSWVRHFFETTAGGQRKCLLPPIRDEKSKKVMKHNELVSADLRTQKQHIAECSWHSSAFAYYKSLKDNGKSDEDAAKMTIEWAQSLLDKKAALLTGGSKPTKFTASEAEKDFVREVSFLCWIAEKNLPFRSVESEFLHEYHAAFGWKDAPSRKRLAGPLLDQVSGLIDKHRAATLGKVDYFCITTDAATLTGRPLCRHHRARRDARLSAGVVCHRPDAPE
jgi:hypothetical protein